MIPMCELCVSAVVTTCASWGGGAAIQQQPWEGAYPTHILPVVFLGEDGFYFSTSKTFWKLELFFKIFCY